MTSPVLSCQPSTTLQQVLAVRTTVARCRGVHSSTQLLLAPKRSRKRGSLVFVDHQPVELSS